MSQTSIKRRLPAFDVVEFFEGATTERGEKVYKNMRVKLMLNPYAPQWVHTPVERVISCSKGIGITEEWIEATIQGLLDALAKDYPNDVFNVVRHTPNDISFEYAGARGVVN